MLFSVPQYIDIEDKIAGPLTAKQLLWLAGMAAAGFLLYVFLPKFLFVVLILPVILLFVALAFYRPQGQPFYLFVFNFITYMFQSKVYVWQRSSVLRKVVQERQSVQQEVQKKKHMLTSEELAELANVLDNEGMERNKQIMSLVQKRQKIAEKHKEKPEQKRDRTLLRVFRKKVEQPKNEAADEHLPQTKQDVAEMKKKVIQLKPEKETGRILYIK